MSNFRWSSPQNMTLAGIGFVLFSVITLIYLVQKTHVALDETRVRLRSTEEKLIASTKRFDSMNEYKTRLETAYLSLKTEKASLLQNEKSAKDELAELKELYSHQMQTLQDDLTRCHLKAKGGHPVGENPPITVPIEFPSQLVPKASSVSPVNRHIRNYAYLKAADHVEEVNSNQLSPKNPAHGPEGTGHSQSRNNNQPAPQPSGDPNEDPAGNVFI